MTKTADNIEKSIESIASDLSGIFRSIDKSVYDASGHPFAFFGKGARSRFTLFMADALSLKREVSEKISVCAELIHTASLLHDDCIDGSSFRRGLPTVQERDGINISILLGDLIVSHAFELTDRISKDLTIELVYAVRKMAEGELMEENFKHKRISVEELRKIISNKTGSLFRWCALAACYLSKNCSLLDVCGKIGEETGISFQIIDDAIDIETGSGDSGKDGLKDILNGKMTLPVILAFDDGDMGRKIEEKLSVIEKSSLPDPLCAAEISKMLRENGFTARARETAVENVKNLFPLIEKLPNREKTEDLKNYLMALAQRRS
ncbi:MAG: polyprenyl synthetase family protein [Elusimicrobia bacterium]|nr:polyprenyl synthetase family protein [Elusimicrobiota bacterium]